MDSWPWHPFSYHTLPGFPRRPALKHPKNIGPYTKNLLTIHPFTHRGCPRLRRGPVGTRQRRYKEQRVGSQSETVLSRVLHDGTTEGMVYRSSHHKPVAVHQGERRSVVRRGGGASSLAYCNDTVRFPQLVLEWSLIHQYICRGRYMRSKHKNHRRVGKKQPGWNPDRDQKERRGEMLNHTVCRALILFGLLTHTTSATVRAPLAFLVEGRPVSSFEPRGGEDEVWKGRVQGGQCL